MPHTTFGSKQAGTFGGSDVFVKFQRTDGHRIHFIRLSWKDNLKIVLKPKWRTGFNTIVLYRSQFLVHFCLQTYHCISRIEQRVMKITHDYTRWLHLQSIHDWSVWCQHDSLMKLYISRVNLVKRMRQKGSLPKWKARNENKMEAELKLTGNAARGCFWSTFHVVYVRSSRFSSPGNQEDLCNVWM